MARVKIENVRIRDLIHLLSDLAETTTAVDITVIEDEKRVIIDPIYPIVNEDPNQIKLTDEDIERIA